jgi:hypothetical protein
MACWVTCTRSTCEQRILRVSSRTCPVTSSSSYRTRCQPGIVWNHDDMQALCIKSRSMQDSTAEGPTEVLCWILDNLWESKLWKSAAFCWDHTQGRTGGIIRHRVRPYLLGSKSHTMLACFCFTNSLEYCPTMWVDYDRRSTVVRPYASLSVNLAK